MAEHIRFHFDPLCPWCWQTSRWIRRLEHLGHLEVDWAVFSLERVNAGAEESREKGHARAGTALRTAIAVRDAAGRRAVGRYYYALGRRHHEQSAELDDDTVRAALVDADLDPVLLDTAQADDALWDAVTAEHDDLVTRTRSFGVPTIVLDGGDGPAIFGPVISLVPNDDDAVALWEHVSWLARYDNFSELKRDRTVEPDLPRFADAG